VKLVAAGCYSYVARIWDRKGTRRVKRRVDCNGAFARVMKVGKTYRSS
jgi:hypothetical protein